MGRLLSSGPMRQCPVTRCPKRASERRPPPPWRPLTFCRLNPGLVSSLLRASSPSSTVADGESAGKENTGCSACFFLIFLLFSFNLYHSRVAFSLNATQECLVISTNDLALSLSFTLLSSSMASECGALSAPEAQFQTAQQPDSPPPLPPGNGRIVRRPPLDPSAGAFKRRPRFVLFRRRTLWREMSLRDFFKTTTFTRDRPTRFPSESAPLRNRITTAPFERKQNSRREEKTITTRKNHDAPPNFQRPGGPSARHDRLGRPKLSNWRRPTFFFSPFPAAFAHTPRRTLLAGSRSLPFRTAPPASTGSFLYYTHSIVSTRIYIIVPSLFPSLCISLFVSAFFSSCPAADATACYSPSAFFRWIWNTVVV